MNTLTKVAVSPHIHSGKSTSGIMRDVIISLLPATVAGAVIFGIGALLPVAVCIVCCVGFEAIFNAITKRPQTVGDLSAVVTGLLLALNLPANVPLWQCAVGSLFAIIIVKCIFGGIGCNIVNPAMTARVFMLIAFESLAFSAFPVDTVASATPLSNGEILPLKTAFFGNYGGSIGETCTLALIIGGVYLLCRRVITWHIPVIYIGTVFAFSYFYTGFDVISALSLTMVGGLFIGAIFMATDYVTSPFTAWGKVIFALGAGLITCLIRYYGTYPEGVSIAILFMNILTPYINQWTRLEVFATGGKK
jgi:electron transport complex protein RnfD